MRILAVLLTLLLATHVCAQAPAANLLFKDGQTVAFMGDSITGMGADVPGGYVHLVVDGLAANGLKITPIPAGVGGNRSTEMLKRVDADVIAKKPDWLTLSCGVNDVWSRSIDLDTFKKQMTEIVDKVQAAGIKIVILTPTPIYEASKNEFNDKLPSYVDFLKQLAHDRNLPCADIHQAWLDYIVVPNQPDSPRSITIDGVHPNPDGHLVFARTILATLGATPEQLATAEKAWRAAPINAAVLTDFGFNGKISLNGDQRAALADIEATQKIDFRRLSETAGLQTARELLMTEDFTKIFPWDLSPKFVAGVQAKIEALITRPASGPGTPEGVGVGFRVSVPMSLSEWDALKKTADTQKLSVVRMISINYMATVRDLLQPQTDFSKIWADDFSAKSTAPFSMKLQDLARQGGWTAPAVANP